MSNKLTPFAKKLRHNATDVETILWRHLKAKQMLGVKFRRQQPIDGYIVDFVSFEKRLVIELDGGQHALNTEKDAVRDQCLTRNGFTVLRFWNNQVLENIEGVLTTIRNACLEHKTGKGHPPPTPSRQGRGLDGQTGGGRSGEAGTRPRTSSRK